MVGDDNDALLGAYVRRHVDPEQWRAALETIDRLAKRAEDAERDLRVMEAVRDHALLERDRMQAVVDAARARWDAMDDADCVSALGVALAALDAVTP